MKAKLLEEDQLALLSKMFVQSRDSLTSDEVSLYRLLVDSLKQAAAIHHRQDPRLDGSGSHLGARSLHEHRSETEISPDKVVRTFISAYNAKRFDLEFHCLSEHFTKAGRTKLPLHEYVEDRKQRSSGRDGIGIRSKELVEISAADIHGNKAVVCCLEKHYRNCGEVLLLCREYLLEDEKDGWKILRYENKKETIV